MAGSYAEKGAMGKISVDGIFEVNVFPCPTTPKILLIPHSTVWYNSTSRLFLPSNVEFWRTVSLMPIVLTAVTIFLIAFSCKRRGVCPSCNARRMAETAAHLVENVIPQLPVHQWVLSIPKRLSYFLRNDPRAINTALHIFLYTVESYLRESCLGAGPTAKIDAIAFIHHFGSSFNEHIHFHCVELDGVFDI